VGRAAALRARGGSRRRDTHTPRGRGDQPVPALTRSRSIHLYAPFRWGGPAPSAGRRVIVSRRARGLGQGRSPLALDLHLLFVAGQSPAWPRRPHVCYGLAERSLKARHELRRVSGAGLASALRRRGSAFCCSTAFTVPRPPPTPAAGPPE